MGTKTGGASPASAKAGPCVLRRGEHQTSSKASLKTQPDSAPEVVTRLRGGSAFVTVTNRPWGWSDPTREFLNPASPAVDRYADALRARLVAEVEREDERRERKHVAKLRERETLALGADAVEFRQQAARLAARYDLPLGSATVILGIMRERRQ